MDPDQIKDVAGKTCRYRGESPLALKAVGQFAETWQRGCCGSLLRVPALNSTDQKLGGL